MMNDVKTHSNTHTHTQNGFNEVFGISFCMLKIKMTFNFKNNSIFFYPLAVTLYVVLRKAKLFISKKLEGYCLIIYDN